MPHAVDMQGHLNRVLTFIEEAGGGAITGEQRRRFPRVWREKILIVDSSKAICRLFTSLIDGREGVHYAPDGAEALKMIENNYFAAIICELNLPGLDGLSLYRRALKAFPGMKERFIFITSDDSFDKINQLKEEGVDYMIKPVPIRAIRGAVKKRLFQRNAHPLDAFPL